MNRAKRISHLNKTKILRKWKISTKSTFILVLGIVMICVGSINLFHRYRATSTEDITIKSLETTIVDSVDNPSETKIEVAKDVFQVAADQPRVLRLPSLNTEGYIQRVGIDKKGNIAAPTNLSLSGWFVDSVKPGEKGLSIIDGHYGGKYSNGIFYNLKNLQTGNTFTIEYGDASEINFKVISVKEVSIEEAQKLLFQKDEKITNQLNLVTCAGEYIKSQETYANRVIVVAERI